ncbi:hypothetical protein SAMN02745172_01919 [Pseudoxanthobacter soli DSM 19599]|uniref:Uncharacterized protein n=1 Tax=Pseudoxanthobacter soli DSM 19599 TaxID=1123029 RepID=A0A1M7ZJ64_9HYPH|nr:hypothetical protein [Pseudoxanthobacter soli]SHO64950.1 hypothetical protein SAMN02745172_01919 [Pseudoxanthobacter soli DSM 19599]
MVSVARSSSASLSTPVRASVRGLARAGRFAAIAVAMVALALGTTAPAVAGAKKTAVPASLKPWAGRWNGPEGLFLEIAPASKPGTVRIVLKDTLDDQATYVGRLDGDVIRFVRNGTAEAIRHGTGAETGFKWLAGKKNCLIVVEDKEGYCR